MATIAAGTLVASRYRLESRLDTGGRAEVWSATDAELERAVAVKLLRPPEGDDGAALEEFHAEAQAEAALDHPNIVEVFDWGHDGDLVYVVMELIEGATLSHVLENQGRQRWEVALGVGRQASSALAYAHQQGIAHGTLAPERIMVAADGRTIVLGFGLRCRGVCEVPPSPDADTYALGGLLYHMLTGHSPFGARPADQPETQPWPRPVHQIAHDCPAEFSRIVMKAISPDAASRYTTAAELQADLEAFARPKSHVWVLAIVAAVVIVAGAAAFWYYTVSQTVVVPYVIGSTSADATTAMQHAGLRLVVSGQATSADVATGTIVSEAPAAGKSAKKGSQVAVVVSTGLPTVNVPSVLGADLQTASKALIAAGLRVGTVTRQNSATIPDGSVISAEPSAGVGVTVGTAVNLAVSAGQATVTVPDVRGVTQSAAIAKLAASGLVPQIGLAYSSLPQGSVISQGPVAGTVVAQGSTVTLSVSQGPAPVVVPNVSGAQTSDARTTLTNLGLVPIVSVEASGTALTAGRPKGTVHTQSPSAGDTVTAGSKVIIYIYN